MSSNNEHLNGIEDIADILRDVRVELIIKLYNQFVYL